MQPHIPHPKSKIILELAMAPTKYDPNKVIAEANQKSSEGDWKGGKFLFESALFEWGDDARENQSVQIVEAVATLWLAYTQYLIQAKQFKSATDAYEEAMESCPVGRIFAEAARFAVERNRAKKAQDIYIKAVSTIKDEQDLELLWNDFLEMMKENNPNLTMRELRAATEQTEATLDNALSSNEPEAKKAKTEGSKTHVITKELVEKGSKLVHVEKLPEEIRAAWIGRDGISLPQRPEPSLFSPSPPKLSDPTAQDILGLELAVDVTKRLLAPTGTLVLEVCRALWSIQALKEQECKSKMDSIENKLVLEHDRLQTGLEARLSVAGAAATAVQQMNERELQEFRQSAEQQREAALSENAWELRKLLCGQQTILCKMEVPCFLEGPTVDAPVLHLQSQICKYLHSAFYIRSKLGSEPHEAMLKSQLKKLQSSALSPKLHSSASPIPPTARLSPLPPSFASASGSNAGVPSIPQHGGDYGSYPTHHQQQPTLQPIVGLPTNYGYHGGPPMMMQQQQQQQPGMNLPPPPPPPMHPQFQGQQTYPNQSQQPQPPQYPPYYR